MDRLLELTDAAQASHFWFAGFRRFVEPAVAQAVNGRRGLRLLDCGCGAGHNLELLRPHGRAFGFDLSSGGLQIAKARRHPLAQADATHLPFTSESFDTGDVVRCAAVHPRRRGRRPRDGAGAAARRRGALTMAAFDILRGDHAVVWNEQRRYTSATAARLAASAGLRAERVCVHVRVAVSGDAAGAADAADAAAGHRPARRRRTSPRCPRRRSTRC